MQSTAFGAKESVFQSSYRLASPIAGAGHRAIATDRHLRETWFARSGPSEEIPVKIPNASQGQTTGRLSGRVKPPDPPLPDDFGIVAAALYVKLQPTPSPLALPAAAATTPVGPLDGTRDVVAGLVAGFRVQENFLGLSNDVVGRTNAVSGVSRRVLRLGHQGTSWLRLHRLARQPRVAEFFVVLHRR